MAKVEPTCTKDGKEAYYKCEGCGKFYEDALGTSQITDLSAWGNIEALGHKDDNNDSKCDICEHNLNSILGDIDSDGFVTMTDVVMLQKAIAKLITFGEDEIVKADVNFDSKNTMEDVILIQRYIARLINKF